MRKEKLMEPKLFLAMKAFVVHNGKVLIVRESSNNPVGTNPNKYDVIGGRLEPGERFDECLEREIKEEIGLSATIKRPFVVNEWRPVVHGEPLQIVGVFFECSAKTDVVTLSADHDDFKWIDPKEYEKYPLIENLRPVFKTFLTR